MNEQNPKIIYAECRLGYSDGGINNAPTVQIHQSAKNILIMSAQIKGFICNHFRYFGFSGDNFFITFFFLPKSSTLAGRQPAL